MPDAPYLRDRGLADNHIPPTPPPFDVNLDTGEITNGGVVEPPPMPVDLPNDYAARLAALDMVARCLHMLPGPLLESARQFHAFLTDTEPTPKVDPAPQARTFTDE